LPSFWCDGDRRGDQIDLSVNKRGRELITLHRDERKVDLEQAGLQPFVHFVFGHLQRLVADAALDAFVDEVLRAIEHDTGPDQPALDHRVEIAGERLLEQRPRIRRKCIVRRRRRRNGGVVVRFRWKGWRRGGWSR